MSGFGRVALSNLWLFAAGAEATGRRRRDKHHAHHHLFPPSRAPATKDNVLPGVAEPVNFRFCPARHAERDCACALARLSRWWPGALSFTRWTGDDPAKFRPPRRRKVPARQHHHPRVFPGAGGAGADDRRHRFAPLWRVGDTFSSSRPSSPSRSICRAFTAPMSASRQQLRRCHPFSIIA